MGNLDISYQALKEQLKTIYANNAGAEGAIEAHLNNVLANLDKNSRQEVLDRLIQEFEHDTTTMPRSPIDAENTTQENMAIDDHVLARVIKLLLGRNVSQADMDSDELMESLAGIH